MFKNNDRYPQLYFDDEYTLQLYMTYDKDGDTHDITFIMKIIKKCNKQSDSFSNLIFNSLVISIRYNHYIIIIFISFHDVIFKITMIQILNSNHTSAAILIQLCAL